MASSMTVHSVGSSLAQGSGGHTKIGGKGGKEWGEIREEH